MRYDTLTLAALGAAALLAACSGRAEPTAATLAAGLSPAHCVAAIEAQTPPDAARCPGFLFAAVSEARTTCQSVDGTLVGADEAAVWTLDANRDGVAEFVYEHDGNVTCEGAYSVFSCGSLGCPKGVYENRNGTWREIAGIFFAHEPAQLVVLEAEPGSYAPLRVGCAGAEPCTELWFFDWNGSTYERTRVAVRGFDVDLVDTINGLYPLAAAIDILATPAPGATSVGRYEAGTHVAIIGTAATREHYYVSPCNACESGFVPRSAVVLP
jgi:hypothetical protein